MKKVAVGSYYKLDLHRKKEKKTSDANFKGKKSTKIARIKKENVNAVMMTIIIKLLFKIPKLAIMCSKDSQNY